MRKSPVKELPSLDAELRLIPIPTPLIPPTIRAPDPEIVPLRLTIPFKSETVNVLPPLSIVPFKVMIWEEFVPLFVIIPPVVLKTRLELIVVNASAAVVFTSPPETVIVGPLRV
jgi:hypothetical protein